MALVTTVSTAMTFRDALFMSCLPRGRTIVDVSVNLSVRVEYNPRSSRSISALDLADC
jgi:hypothetical protein